MRVRHIISKKKRILRDTLWKDGLVPPRHCPVLNKSKPLGEGWVWRSAALTCADGHDYILFVQARPARLNWSARLLVSTPKGWSCVARFESHPCEPRHAHADCDRSGQEVGPTSMDTLTRFPASDLMDRPMPSWDRESFWAAAQRFYRVTRDMGPLFEQASDGR